MDVTNNVVTLRDSGKTWREVAAGAGLGSETSARRAYARAVRGMTFFAPDVTVVHDIRSALIPLAYELPKPVKPAKGNALRVLLYGDSHFPFHDEAALDIVKQVGQIIDPTHVIHVGDLIDAYHLSRFDKNPDRKHSVQDEIDQARAHLASMRATFPGAKMFLLEGNHDQRLERTLWAMEGPARALLTLTKMRQVLTWPSLLGLDELRITWVAEKDQPRTEILPKMILKHGTVVRKWSGATAKGEWEKYGRSGASGHVHRLAAFWHGKHDGGAHTWVETGCTCSLTPEYMVDTDWQQGCVVLTVEEERGTVSPEMVYIRDGRTAFRGNILQTR